MAQVGVGSRVGGPGAVIANQFGSTVSINGNTDNSIRSDGTTNFANTANINLTVESATLATGSIAISSGGNRSPQPSDTIFNGINGRMHFTNTGTIQGDWFGHHVFDGFTHQLSTPNGGTRYIFGGFTGNGNWGFTVGPGGWDLVNNSASQLVFHGGNINFNQVFVNGPIRLIGNSFSQANAGVALFAVTPSNVADTEAFDNSGVYNGVSYGYSWRMAHQQGPDGNINNIVAGTGGRTALYTNFEPTTIVLPGSVVFATDGSTSNNARQSVVQMNRRVAWWMMDPIMGNELGGDNQGSNLLVGFHAGQAPGTLGNNGATTASQINDSEIRMFVSDRPVFRDGSSGNLIPGVFKLEYADVIRELPDAWDPDVVPLEVANNSVEITQTALEATYNGVMIQDQNQRYGQGPDAQNTINAAGRDPANNPFTLLSSHDRTALRSFDYNLPYLSTVLPHTDGSGATGLIELAETRVNGNDLAEYLNGRDSTFVAADINDFADVFPGLRSVWYASATPLGAWQITSVGTTLTFDRTTTFSTTAATSITLTDYTINMLDESPVLTGDNTTFDFGIADVNWDGIVFPDGIIMAGGSHGGLGDMTGINWVSQGTTGIDVNLTPNADGFEVEPLVGLHTGGNVILNNLSGQDIVVNGGQAGFTAGTNVIESSQIDFLNRSSTSTTQRITVWELDTLGDVILATPIFDIVGQGTTLQTINQTAIPIGTNVRVVWNDAGFEPFAQDFVTIVGLLEVSLVRTATANASTIAIPAGVAVTTSFAAGVLTYSFAGVDSRLAGGAANNTAESAKTTSGFSEAVANLNITNLISHSAVGSTSFLIDTFMLEKNGLTAPQAEITGYVQIDTFGAITSISSSLIGALPGNIVSIILFPPVTLELADVIGALDVQTDDIRVVVDEELKVGVLTNIGRP